MIVNIWWSKSLIQTLKTLLIKSVTFAPVYCLWRLLRAEETKRTRRPRCRAGFEDGGEVCPPEWTKDQGIYMPQNSIYLHINIAHFMK